MSGVFGVGQEKSGNVWEAKELDVVNQRPTPRGIA